MEQESAKKSSVKDVKHLTFEAAMQELDVIVRQLEAGNIELESAIEQYTRGVALKEHCEAILNKAKLKVEKIIVKDGKATGLEAFDVENKAG